MTTFKEGLQAAFDALIRQAQPVVDAGEINGFVKGAKTKGSPKTPYAKIVPWDIPLDSSTIGSAGIELWKFKFKVGAVVKNKIPSDGMIDAASIISTIWSCYKSDRSLGIPNLCRGVEASRIEITPFPFGANGNLYGAGVEVTVPIIIDE